MLPFIGRSEEIGLIRNLSREIVQGDGLGLLWIEGEAGIGKSHLLKQSLPLLEEDQLLPLHAQLYPDSSSSVWSLVADVLSNDRTIQHLLLEPTKPTPVSVTKALRRLSRLRPVVLVIEDVHLLDERGKYELTELLRAIQGNPICLIMASRTEGGAIYGLALSYLVQTIQLKPLTVSEIHQLLIECQAPESSLEMAEEFHRATRGIPFVVRSVLAGMSSEFRRNSPIAYNGNGKSFRKLIEARSRMSMEQIIFDLTAKLTSEQLDAAKRLALLGQVFSEGSAIMLLGKETNDILHVLQQEGVISKLVEPSTPLFSKPDISSEEVWKFSHTILVHLFQRSAYEQGEDLLDTELLITLLSSSTSFYSITPLVYLSQRDYKEGEKVKAIATLMIGMTWSLAKTPHISIMPKLYYATRTFYERNRHSLATDVQEELGLALLNLQLLTTLHQRFSPKHREAQQQLLDKTADPQSHLVATYRIYALSSMSLVNRTIPEYLQFKLDEADAIVKKFPDLLRDSAFIKLLVLVACTFYKSRLDGLYNRVRRYYDIIQEALSSSSPTSDTLQSFHQLGIGLSQVFWSSDDLKDREELLSTAFASISIENVLPEVYLSYIRFLRNSGKVREARSVVMRMMNRLDDLRLEVKNQGQFYLANAALGMPLSRLEEDLRKVVQQARSLYRDNLPSGEASAYEKGIVANVMEIANERGNLEWGVSLAQALIPDVLSIAKDVVRFKLCSNDPDDLRVVFNHSRRDLDRLTGETAHLTFLMGVLLGEQEAPDSEIRERAMEILQIAIVNRNQLMDIQTTIGIIEQLSGSSGSESLANDLAQTIEEAIERCLIWTSQNQLAGLMEPFLALAHRYMQKEPYRTWQQRYKTILDKNIEEFDWADRMVEVGDQQKVEVKMIGKITLQHPDQEPLPVSGLRARHILGLITANHLMARSLSLQEFRELAFDESGNSSDSANALRVAISRIRSMIGKEAIISDGESAPRFNFDVVRVDLLEIGELLTACEHAGRKLFPLRASQLLMRVLKALNREPIYPALYTDFFEAARLDFDLRLRQAILSTTALLRQEGDTERAAELLYYAFEQMPTDNEIGEELCSVLQLLGRHTEVIAIQKSLEEILI